MSENLTDSLLEELKNLNKDLKNELKKEEIANSSVSVSVSSTSGVNLRPNTPQIPVAAPFKLDETNLNSFILDNAQKIIQEGVKTIKDLQGIVGATFDSKLLLGYSAIIQATTTSIDTLNKLNIVKQQFVANKEIKQMDIDARKQLTSEKKGGNTLNIIATREEIIKMMQGIDEKPAIEVKSKELPLESLPEPQK